MAGDLEMNSGEGSGPVEVGSGAVNLDEQIGAQSEQSLKEVAEATAVVEEIPSTGTDIAIPEKHGKRRPHLDRHIDCRPSYANCDRFCFSFSLVHLVVKF